MSFFSKLNKEFEGLMKDKKEEKPAGQPSYDATRGYGDQPQYGYGAPPQQGYPPPGQYNSPPPQQYGAPPGQYSNPPQQYGGPPQGQYNSPPPAQQYGAFSPPAHIPAAGGVPPIPFLPSGWQALWDPAGQRWAYLETGNSKVSWTVPTGPSFAQANGSRGFGDEGSHGAYGTPVGYGAPGAYGGGHDQSGGAGYVDQARKDKDAKKMMMMGAAGGVAVGAIGGALIANALDDDDDHHGGGGGYGGGYQQGPPPMDAPLPDVDHDGSSVSSSDREEVEKAREEYEEAYEETYGSD